MSSIRDRIAARPRASEQVTVPEWDVTVEVRPISVARRGEVFAGGDDDATRTSLRLLVAAVFDPESGDPAFTEDDLGMLGEQEAGVIDRLLAEVMRVSGLSRDAVESGKDAS